MSNRFAFGGGFNFLCRHTGCLTLPQSWTRLCWASATMFGVADLKLCGVALLLVLGVLANIFNMGVMLWQQWRSGGMMTMTVIICFISLGNIFLQICTFVLVAYTWVGVLCWSRLPFFFCVVLFVWLSSSSVSFWSVAWLSVFYCVKVLRFSSGFFRMLRENLSCILNVTMLVTLLTSCMMFTPFLYLHFQSKLQNGTDIPACVIKKPLLPVWIHVNTYVIIFISYLTLMPSMIMLPTSLSLVVYLCKHTLAVRKQSSSTESYVFVCRLMVALVWVYLTTLLIISLYYFHAIFASGLSADILFLGLSFYCVACAVLLSCSNKYLREKCMVLVCRGTSTKTRAIAEDKRGVTATV